MRRKVCSNALSLARSARENKYLRGASQCGDDAACTAVCEAMYAHRRIAFRAPLPSEPSADLAGQGASGTGRFDAPCEPRALKPKHPTGRTTVAFPHLRA